MSKKAVTTQITEKNGHTIEQTYFVKKEHEAVFAAAKTGKDKWDIESVKVIDSKKIK